jgi:hypothetical protein
MHSRRMVYVVVSRSSTVDEQGNQSQNGDLMQVAAIFSNHESARRFVATRSPPRPYFYWYEIRVHRMSD